MLAGIRWSRHLPIGAIVSLCDGVTLSGCINKFRVRFFRKKYSFLFVWNPPLRHTLLASWSYSWISSTVSTHQDIALWTIQSTKASFMIARTWLIGASLCVPGCRRPAILKIEVNLEIVVQRRFEVDVFVLKEDKNKWEWNDEVRKF